MSVCLFSSICQCDCLVEEAIVAALCYMSVMRFSSICQCDSSVVYVSVTVQ